jgi:hypothetical protein
MKSTRLETSTCLLRRNEVQFFQSGEVAADIFEDFKCAPSLAELVRVLDHLDGGRWTTVGKESWRCVYGEALDESQLLVADEHQGDLDVCEEVWHVVSWLHGGGDKEEDVVLKVERDHALSAVEAEQKGVGPQGFSPRLAVDVERGWYWGRGDEAWG